MIPLWYIGHERLKVNANRHTGTTRNGCAVAARPFQASDRSASDLSRRRHIKYNGTASNRRKIIMVPNSTNRSLVILNRDLLLYTVFTFVFGSGALLGSSGDRTGLSVALGM